LAKVICDLTREFPVDEKWGLTSQLGRAAVSVSSNITEGYGRRVSKDYVSFLCSALGNVKEIKNELFVA